MGGVAHPINRTLITRPRYKKGYNLTHTLTMQPMLKRSETPLGFHHDQSVKEAMDPTTHSYCLLWLRSRAVIGVIYRDWSGPAGRQKSGIWLVRNLVLHWCLPGAHDQECLVPLRLCSSGCVVTLGCLASRHSDLEG
jgi:hypothetical protein